MVDTVLFFTTAGISLTLMGSFGAWIGRHFQEFTPMLLSGFVALEALIMTVFVSLVARGVENPSPFLWFHWLVLITVTVASTCFHAMLVSDYKRMTKEKMIRCTVEF